MNEFTASEVLTKFENKEDIHLIDVREDFEISAGMIPNAKHIPLGEIPSRLNELDKDKLYIMICRSGNRSEQAAEYLNESGYQAINMSGGMLDWDGPIE